MKEELQLSRTLGYEIECFVDDRDMINERRYGLNVGSDGSVEEEDEDTDYSGEDIEARTSPTKDLNHILDVYNHLAGERRMKVNRTCGLHIHVDTSDYTLEDKVKLLRFGAGIEYLMYALVEPYRWGNTYSKRINYGWRKVFRKSFIEQDFDINNFSDMEELSRYINSNKKQRRNENVWNGKYQWLNTVTSFPTVEFRIFNATTSGKEAVEYGMLAYHIVEMVKHSTVKQISFIIKNIYESTSIEEMFDKLFDSISLPSEYRPSIKNDSLKATIEEKFCMPNVQQDSQEA